MSRIWTVLAAALLVAPAGLQAQTNDAAPLPLLETVLSHAAEAAAKEDYYQDVLNSRYDYERSRVTETRTSGGRVKQHEEKYNTNSPSLEVAAQPLPPYVPESPAEAAEESRKRNQLIDVTELVTNVLAHAQMKITGREMINGRPTLVVDFQPPDRKVPEDSLMDRLINRAAGRAWVDEEDYTLARLETHLTDKLNVFAGFGAVMKGDYSFDRERTAEGVWYSRDIHYNADIREFIFYRTLTYQEVYTNVCRPPGLSGVATTTR